jgi:hypothetical protein
LETFSKISPPIGALVLISFAFSGLDWLQKEIFSSGVRSFAAIGTAFVGGIAANHRGIAIGGRMIEPRFAFSPRYFFWLLMS